MGQQVGTYAVITRKITGQYRCGNLSFVVDNCIEYWKQCGVIRQVPGLAKHLVNLKLNLKKSFISFDLYYI